ncbi:ferredoxin [Saccharomonospora marina XMU15]|uniref:Ferredoxin n=1 Tax=Saccharomonospora marina XMU15 TaxID=882083 RepID=H5X3J9_9PSEU|nr:(4Fe-4S)-binding protein [Saccharomonospora marina]EHR49933.1 ferredoxin [Saccharomonospora marina XMU15]
MIEADRDICIAAGVCAMTAPDVFDQDDDGIVVLRTDNPGPDNAEAAREAVDSCPSGALRLRDT